MKWLCKCEEYAVAAAKGVGAVVFCLLYLVLYFVVGMLIAFPYHWMAGESPPIKNIELTMVLSPVIVIVLIFFNMIGSGIKYRDGEWHPQSHWSFWVIFAYTCTPIWVAALSGVAAMLGWERTASILFAVRYESFILVPIILIVGCIMYWKSMDAWHGWGFGNGGDPPRQTPDSQAETRESNARLNEDGNSMQRMLQTVTL